jgi:hypothetical protein
MKIKVATIYLKNGVLVADKRCGIVIRAKLNRRSKNRFRLRAIVERERQKLFRRWFAGCGGKINPQQGKTWEGKCESVAGGIRIRLRTGRFQQPSRLRTKVVCRTLWDRVLAEADKVRAANKNAARNKDRWYCKCMSVNRNIKTRCGLGKHNCASAREMHEILKRQGFCCALTGDLLVYDDYTDNARCDHKTPVSRGGVSTSDNLQWVTAAVNAAKGKMTNEEFIEMCRKVVATADANGAKESMSHPVAEWRYAGS